MVNDSCWSYYFKFQSDSINTDKLKKAVKAILDFKFQSDSINTRKAVGNIICTRCFKFQSDSINTVLSVQSQREKCWTLNSNLILLIQNKTTCEGAGR